MKPNEATSLNIFFLKAADLGRVGLPHPRGQAQLVPPEVRCLVSGSKMPIFFHPKFDPKSGSPAWVVDGTFAFETAPRCI